MKIRWSQALRSGAWTLVMLLSLHRSQGFAQAASQPESMSQEASAPLQGAAPGADPHATDEIAAQRQALGFLGYLDKGRYGDSYAYTGMLIRTHADRGSFASQIKKARAGVGSLQSRTLEDAGYFTSVPGAPEGQYVVLHYRSGFANRPDTVETLTLDFARGYWRVSGYFIK